MHTTGLDSCTLLHDGDFDGCMYLGGTADDGTEQRIVVTREGLEEALRIQQDETTVRLKGPCADIYDRHSVTLPPEYQAIKAMDFEKEHTLLIDRNDLESIAVFYRTSKISSQVEQLAAPLSVPFGQAVSQLDRIIVELEALQS